MLDYNEQNQLKFLQARVNRLQLELAQALVELQKTQTKIDHYNKVRADRLNLINQLPEICELPIALLKSMTDKQIKEFMELYRLTIKARKAEFTTSYDFPVDMRSAKKLVGLGLLYQTTQLTYSLSMKYLLYATGNKSSLVTED